MGGKKRAKRAASAPSGASINTLGLIVAVVGLAGLFGLVVFLGEPPPRSTDAPELTSRNTENMEPELSPVESWQTASWHDIPVEPRRDFIRGPVDAPVTIVEFTDFECPFCKIAHRYVSDVLKRYPDDVRLVYKNFPLDVSCNDDMAQQLHPSACKAAVMARCAGARDSKLFWQFHDAIFESDGFNDEWLNVKAAELGVDDYAFQACVSGRAQYDEVRVDLDLARDLGVSSTPSLYVNGRAAPSYEVSALVEIIDHILDSD